MTTLECPTPAVAPTVASTVPPAPVRRIPPNLFAIGLGLAGLAQAWTVAARHTSVPIAVTSTLWLLAAAVWVVTLVSYGRSLVLGHRVRTELSDHTFGPFVSLPAIVGLLLSGGLEPHARLAAELLFTAALLSALALAGRLLAIWALDDAPETHWHPGYYLPSVGAPLVASAEAASFGFDSLARLLLGFGLISFVLIGGILLHHLVGQQRLATPLIPTMAILIAPPILAGNAWFAINGGRVDGLALGLAGYALLMAVVQVGLLPAYRTVPFGPGWWSFSFPFAATAGNGILWLAAEHTRHQTALTYLVLGVITAFIGYLAVRTVVALARGRFLPGRAAGQAGAPRPPRA